MKTVLKLFLVGFALAAFGCSKNDKITDPVIDIDGNTYKTVTIGAQVWMAENLRTTKLNDGTEIPLVKDATAWNNLTSQGFCWYNNDEALKNIYGAIYNGYTVSTGKICPTGWHIAENEEWRILRSSLGDSLRAGGKLKEAGTEHWLTPNKGADNSIGFTALPAGLRYFEGTFSSLSSFSGIWSATETGNEEWFVGLYHSDAAFIMDHRNKKHGFSIRCLKN